ncbi:MAG: amino acid decarboxylase [Ruminococcaceae bacterium]|nr:amino acid decarboxylase [Oscillospiraceae bacterium]
MRTPIADFVRRYAERDAARFHMPGHKGRGALGIEQLDITEIAGADVLYAADGIIAESEENATALFGSAHTFYSTEGSTLAIKAMLATVCATLPRGERMRVLAARNAHKAFLYAAALLDIEVSWVFPERQLHPAASDITADAVQKAYSSLEKKPHAVYLTTPDYLGGMADVADIAARCRSWGIPLLVDHAHGAYLRFLEPERHPLALGAAMCAESAHKTLPALTGGAYLHVAKRAPQAYAASARQMLSLFASTSPSYLILQSLDLCNRRLAADYGEELRVAAERVRGVRARLLQRGIKDVSAEPLKLALHASECGYTGEAWASLLRERGIEAEFYDRDFLVLMCSADHTERDFGRLCSAIGELPQASNPCGDILPAVPHPRQVLSPREAILSPAVEVALDDAVGRISASPTVSCPPAVPIVMSGEMIDGACCELLRYYGVERVLVVRE